ncbi:MAG: ABC transporter ATP-binding protein [Methanothrix sp.]|jgi:iron complex transport system ATP-binding protein|nr:ABC transporter ATP-binding protein [Methanothrix sp.]OPX82237.1 MAG: Cobalamin import ATP-binding protein BtuD [Methanosaeta sp. PtaB.Bin087]NLX40011.1 ABC transporter ATP-binding protein [Methanothrix sp.]HNR57053.1 ABC transporter ATP-binding protein [Methanothrix sp.]HNT73082.1 ABC transporter ATP-binding protein [Methanothrix sp.]
MSGIEVRDLSFGYNGILILNGIDLSIDRGSTVTLLGPNGCGKTTLLKTINDLLKPASGSVVIDGKLASTMGAGELARVLGYVPQDHRSSFPFTSFDIVLTGRIPHISTFSSPGARDFEEAHRALELVGAGHLSDRPYTQISGGERQMVMIARALAQDPHFLLLDEPTSYLDFKNQVKVLKTIRSIALRERVTVIMTLHDPNHALAYSDRVILMRRLPSEADKAGPHLGLRGGGPSMGNVVAYGPPAEVMTPENMEKAYGMKVEIFEHNGRRIILPV